MSDIYPGGDHQLSVNLGLGLWGTDEVTTDNFLLIDAAFGSISGSVNVNGTPVPAPANFINSATVTFSVAGSNISLTSAGGGSGTVSSFSAGNLSPLFTTSVANPTTTPALTFSLSNAGQNDVLAGPASGGSGAPTYRALVAADIPVLSYVTSVGLSVPNIFSVSGSPVTSSGTLTVTLATETANTIFAGPASGVAATPTFRALVTADLPSGTGTVTSFSAGTLSPLFTTSVATSTTTPALSFSLTNAAGGTVFGNPTGAATAPSYTATPVLGINTSVAGTLGLATSVASGTTITIQNLGALTAYNFNLPLTVGAAGSVLTSQAGGSAAMTWTTEASLGVSWSSLTNASANLTLANAGFTTTFNQTSGVAWLWANTTAGTASTTNASPLLEVAANYWTGSASATDTWTIGSSLSAGTNGASTLAITHSGTTGIQTVAIVGAGGNNTKFFIGSTTEQSATGVLAAGAAFFTNGTTYLLAVQQAANSVSLSSTVPLQWGSTTSALGTVDTGLSRSAAGVLAIGNGTAASTAGNLAFNRTNIAGADGAGTATITAGSTSISVVYAANYTGVAAPVVVVTPTSDPLAAGVPVGYWVVATGATTAWTGFQINIQTALVANVTFGYVVIGKA